MFRATVSRIHRPFFQRLRIHATYTDTAPRSTHSAPINNDQHFTLPSYIHDEGGLLQRTFDTESHIAALVNRVNTVRHLYSETDEKKLIDLHLVCQSLSYSERTVPINQDVLLRQIFHSGGSQGRQRQMILLWRQWTSGAGGELLDNAITLVGSDDVDKNIIRNVYWTDIVYKSEVQPLLDKGDYVAALGRVLRFLQEDFRDKRNWLETQS